VTGYALAWELVKNFLNARYHGTGRFKRRLDKVLKLENEAE
jgi:ribose 5-phosphate isomerase RpiB